MKKAIILPLALICIGNLYCKAQQIGDDAVKVKYIVQMTVQEYYNAQGYHQVKEDYNVLMDNGSIREVILQKENVPDINLQRAISFRIRYIMKGGILNRVLQEYFDVNVSELMNAFKANYRGNSINDYYFKDDYSTYTRIYLGANKLATSETKATQLIDFPPHLREVIKNSMREAKKHIEQERENGEATQIKEEAEDYNYRNTWYELAKYDTSAFSRFQNRLKKNFFEYFRSNAPEYKDLWYGGRYNGFVNYDNLYSILYKKEDHSRNSEKRGNAIIAGSDNLYTTLSGTLLMGADQSLKIVQANIVELPMLSVSGKKALSKAQMDSMRVLFVKGVTVVKCGKNGVEFTKLPPPENIKPSIEGKLAGKKGKFIVKYEIANILNEPFENVTVEPNTALFGEYR